MWRTRVVIISAFVFRKNKIYDFIVHIYMKRKESCNYQLQDVAQAARASKTVSPMLVVMVRNGHAARSAYNWTSIINLLHYKAYLVCSNFLRILGELLIIRGRKLIYKLKI